MVVSVVRQNINRVQVSSVNTALPKSFRREIALKRREKEHAVFVVVDDELNKLIAQTADAIVKNDVFADRRLVQLV